MPYNIIVVAIFATMFLSVLHIDINTICEAAKLASVKVDKDEEVEVVSNKDDKEYPKDDIIEATSKWHGSEKETKKIHRRLHRDKIRKIERNRHNIEPSMLSEKVSIPCKVIKNRQDMIVRDPSLAHIKKTLKKTLVESSRTTHDGHHTCPSDKFQAISALIETFGPIEVILSDAKAIHHLGVIGFAALGEDCASKLIQAADKLLNWNSFIQRLSTGITESQKNCNDAWNILLPLVTDLDHLNDDIDFSPKVCLRNEDYRACFSEPKRKKKSSRGKNKG